MPLRFDSFLQGGAGGFPGPMPAEPALFSSVKLLVMNGGGSDGNQDMVDQSDSAHSLTWDNEAQMDTGVERFAGKPTLLLDGSNDQIYAADHADFSLGTLDFTFQGWVYPTATVGSMTILSQYLTTGNWRAWFFRRDSDGKLRAWFSSTGSGLTFEFISTATIPQDEWSFVVVQREGNDFTMWIAGARDAAPTTNSLSIKNVTSNLWIGARYGNETNWTGNLGPQRLIVGEAIHPGAPSSIIVPTGPYPTS